ncbi:MAG: SdrD B-like domain-containing protein [Gammaproteobacteria bacterium]
MNQKTRGNLTQISKRNPHHFLSSEKIASAWEESMAADGVSSENQRQSTEAYFRFSNLYQSLHKQPRSVRRKLQNICKMPLARTALLLALGLGHTLPASAAGIWVNTLVPDINPNDGKCSLIEAIENANADAKVHSNCQRGNGADTIYLWRNNTYSLDKIHNSRTEGAEVLVNGLPVITSKIKINGKGATIERRGGSAEFFRLFEVAVSGDLSLSHLTLRGVRTEIYTFQSQFYTATPFDVYTPIGPGGAVSNAGKVSMSNVRVIDSVAGSSTSDDVGAVHNTGQMVITNSAFIDDGSHGLNYSSAISNSGRLTISGTLIDGSGANTGVNNFAGGHLEIRNSTITGNHEAIVNAGSLSLNHSTVAGNLAYTKYAKTINVISNTGDLTLSNNLISGNAVVNYFKDYSGTTPWYFSYLNQHAVIQNSGTINSRNNVLGHNGLAFSSSDLTISPSFAQGFTPDSSDIVATIDGNQPTPLQGIMKSEDSVLAWSHIMNSSQLFQGPVPILENNGGLTNTIALVPGSIAIDAANDTCPATDQRGVTRPQGTACDIGAYEFEQSVASGTGVMGDFVWEDLNNDGIQDSDEPGMANVTVELLSCAGNLVDITTTDSTGHFSFKQIAASDGYQMQYKLPASHQFSPVNQGGNYRLDSNADQSTGLTPCLPIADGQSRLAIDAGMSPTGGGGTGTGVMGDYVWNDLNGDGVQDSDEPGLANVSIDLLSCSGDQMDTTFSDANGGFRFTSIAPGSYQMRYNLLANHRYSPAGQGGNYRTDSNVDTTTGLTPCLTIEDGQQRLAVDGGMLLNDPVVSADPELSVEINAVSAAKPGPTA